jgi:hypothetical protein
MFYSKCQDLRVYLMGIWQTDEPKIGPDSLKTTQPHCNLHQSDYVSCLELVILDISRHSNFKLQLAIWRSYFVINRTDLPCRFIKLIYKKPDKSRTNTKMIL